MDLGVLAPGVQQQGKNAFMRCVASQTGQTIHPEGSAGADYMQAVSVCFFPSGKEAAERARKGSTLYRMTEKPRANSEQTGVLRRGRVVLSVSRFKSKASGIR